MDKEIRISFHDQISKNRWKSIFLIIIIFIMFVVVGFVIGSIWFQDAFFMIMIAFVIISIVYLVITYYNSDKIALASVSAKIANKEKYKQYYHSVEALTLASGLPMPKLYVMENSMINAFASGRNPEHAVICVTTGALEKLDKQELEGVLGHELSHIANYDIRFMTLAAVMVGMIVIISQVFLRSLWFRSLSGGGNNRDNKSGMILMIIGIVLAILAPIFVMLIQLAISRKREYSADASAVKFIRSPTGLIHALKKIKKEHPEMKDKEKSEKTISKSLAPLFMADPYKKHIKKDSFWQTHPSIDKRINILEKM